MNGVGVRRKASGRGSGIKKRAGRIGVVGMWAGFGREFEGNWERERWFGDKKGARRWPMIRGTG